MNIRCDGEITFVDAQDITTAQCSVGWSVSASSFDPAADIDPTLMAGAAGAGFFILTPVWLACLGLRFLLRAIRN